MPGHENASEYFKCTIKKEVGNSLSFFSFCSFIDMAIILIHLLHT